MREIARLETDGRPYLEFLRVPDLSVGLYMLPVGGEDPRMTISLVVQGEDGGLVFTEDAEDKSDEDPDAED